jgi:hypothetical protein
MLHLAPYYILGQDVFIGIHDTFDAYFVWYKVLAESGMILSGITDVVPIIMDGLPRISFGSEFNVLVWLFYFFDPFTVYVVNMTFMHFVGFVGMYLLLKTHFLKAEKYKILSLGVAVCFAILPLWPPGGLSVSSLPLALYALLNIRASQSSRVDWLILILIPFYASIVFSYLFFLSMMGGLWLWSFIRTRQHGLRFFAAMAMMTVEFLLIEYRLVIGMIMGQGFVSHRTDFEVTGLTLQESLSTALENFLRGHYHAPTLQGLVILFAIAFAVIVILGSKYDSGRKPLLVLGLSGMMGILAAIILFSYDSVTSAINGVLATGLLGPFFPLSLLAGIGLGVGAIILLVFLARRLEPIRFAIQHHIGDLKMVAILLGICALISLWFGLWSSALLVPWKQQFTILQTIKLSRFHWLHPLLWYLLFAISLKTISGGINVGGKECGKLIAIALILLQLTVVLPTNWEAASARAGGHDNITYRQFFAEDLFQEIEDDIGLSQSSYRVVSIGLHPAVSQFNGFHTLDGYSNNYPLEYKLRFRNIISAELAKDAALRSYFDNWGSRCYILTHELGNNFYCTKEKGLVINNIALNTTALLAMGCSYIFSAVNITNHMANGLQLNGVYENNNSAWRIFLYEII